MLDSLLVSIAYSFFFPSGSPSVGFRQTKDRPSKGNGRGSLGTERREHNREEGAS